MSFDHVVVGAGIAGASVAYHLRKAGARVLLLERGEAASGGTGRSAAIMRQSYSTPLLVRLARESMAMLGRSREELGRDAGYVKAGYCFLLSGDMLEGGRRNVAMQKSMGIVNELREGCAFPEHLPEINPEGIAGIVYEPLAGTTLYGHYVSGTNPSRNFTLGRALDFALESSTEYELGVRQKFWGNRAEAGIAVYDIVKENILTQRPNNANVTDNIGRQSARGVEISLGVEPVAGWRVGGNASFLTAEFDEFNVSGQSFAGRVPPNVPRQLGNLWTHYRFGNGFDVGGNVRYVGPRSGDNAGTFVLPSYATLDLYASYTVNNWEFSLRGRNLTDELAIVWSETDYTQQVQTGEPRAIEARVTARF